MRANLRNLTAWQRWIVYFAITALPGLCVFRLFGWPGSIVYELVMWIPQQRIFDHLRLAETLPYANTVPATSR